MDTIKEYIDNLFLGLPDTDEVRRAKAELLEMMEDKYEELLSEGKSEEEAVGVVISEFGNLEEIAEELGISEQLKQTKGEDDTERNTTGEGQSGYASAAGGDFRSEGNGYQSAGNVYRTEKKMDLEQVKDYLAYAWKHAWMVGIGVMCFILTPFLMTMYEEFEDLFSGSAAGEYFDAFSLFVFLCGIIAGVVFSVKAKQLRKENALPPNCHLILMEDALEYYKEQKKNEEGKRNNFKIIGIILCIVWIFPSSLSMIRIPFVSEFLDDSIFPFVGIGVLLLIVSESVGKRCIELEKRAFISGKNSAAGQGNAFQTDGGYQEGENSGMTSQMQAFPDAKPKKYTGLIIFLVILGILLVLSIVGAVVAGFAFLKSGSIQENITEENLPKTVVKSYEPERVRKISVDLDTEDVIVHSEDDLSKIDICYEGDHKLTYDLSGGELKIREKSRFSFVPRLFFWNMRSERLVINLPKEASFLGDMDIALDTGDVWMEGLQVDHLSVDTDTGDITLLDTIGKVTTIDADTGAVRVEESNEQGYYQDGLPFESLECDLDTGDFAMRMAVSEEDLKGICSISLDSDVGDISFYGSDCGNKMSWTPEMISGKVSVLKVETDTGDIEIGANK